MTVIVSLSTPGGVGGRALVAKQRGIKEPALLRAGDLSLMYVLGHSYLDSLQVNCRMLIQALQKLPSKSRTLEFAQMPLQQKNVFVLFSSPHLRETSQWLPSLPAGEGHLWEPREWDANAGRGAGNDYQWPSWVRPLMASPPQALSTPSF